MIACRFSEIYLLFVLFLDSSVAYGYERFVANRVLGATLLHVYFLIYSNYDHR